MDILCNGDVKGWYWCVGDGLSMIMLIKQGA